MGKLKKIVEQSVKHINSIETDSAATLFFKDSEQKFKNLEGARAVWKTKGNPIVRSQKLVRIIKAYPFHVLIEAETYTYEGTRSLLNYSVGYSSLLAGFDSLRILE